MTARSGDTSGLGAERSDLWMVLALIQPFKLDAVTLALEGLAGFGGMTVTPCRGFGQEKVGEAEADGGRQSEPERRRADAGLVDFTDKLRLEIAVAGRDQADAVIDVVSRTAHTGNRGDGKIFAWPIARAVRVRTFDEGALAL